MKRTIFIGAAALGMILRTLPAFSASVGERFPDVSSPAGVAMVSADSDTSSDTAIPGIPFFLNDTSFGDTGLIDTLHAVHLFDSSGSMPADTLTVHIDSAFPSGLPIDTMPPWPMPKSKEETAAEIRPSWLYPGLSMEQHSLAMQMLACFYNFDWNDADKFGKKLLRLEKKKQLPPLGYLLLIGMRVLRFQLGEYGSGHEKTDLLQEINKLAGKGLELADPNKSPDSCRATNQFIIGGINGFIATLDIDASPTRAAFRGFAALRHLQKALVRDSSLYDAYLGIGLFNCILAKAPFFIRSALAIIGKNVSFPRGLTYLRICARQGCYADEIAKLYLAEFLSPYLGDEAAEKQEIFNSLERSYPQNPYFVFLDLDENLCFHKQTVFNFSYRTRLKRRISQFKPLDNYSKLYVNLVKWQYLVIDPFPASGISPDTSSALGDFAFYPVFLQALRERYLQESGDIESKADQLRRRRYIKSLGDSALRMLQRATSLPPSRRNFYRWHIHDALQIKDNETE
ncbi:MAG: hypothetical protein ABSE00_06030 [Chitinispirillaceae bacterium]|jgi:hypothetical protein